MPENRLRIKLAVPETELRPLYQKKLQQFAESANIPGFRKGKVPPNVIKERLGDQVNDEVINEIASLAMEDFLQKEEIAIYGKPYLEDRDVVKNFDAEKPLNLNIICYLPPTCKIKSYDSLSFREDTLQIDDEDIQQTFHRVMRPHGKLVEVQDEVKPLDIVEMDLFFDSSKYESFQLSRHVFYFEKDSTDVYPPYLNDLKSSIFKKKAGDEWSEKVAFSKTLVDEYKSLAGVKAVCRCVIHTVKRMELPELTEELLKKVGAKDREDLMEQIRTNLQQHGESMLREYINNTLLVQLKKKSEFGIPELAIHYIIGHYWKEYLDRYVPKEEREKKMPEETWIEEAKKQALRDIEIQLIFDRMIEDFKEITPSEQEITVKIEELSKNLDPKEKENWEKQMDSAEIKQKIKEKMQHERAIDYLRSKAKKKKGQQFNYRELVAFVRQEDADKRA